MSSASVRPAGPEDLELLVESNLSLASSTEGRMLDAGRLRNGVGRALDDPDRGRYWIAELDGRPVGSLLVTREWSDWRDGWFWWIQSVWVRPEARRRGVYAALHGHVRRRAALEGGVVGLRLYVDRENAAARTVYERMGMAETGYRLYEQPPPGV